MKFFLFPLILLFASVNLPAQIMARDLPNSYTYSSVIPYGCLTVVPSVLSEPPETVYFDEDRVIFDGGLSGTVRLRAWRTGCHEPNASAIMLNVDVIGGSALIRYPKVSLVTRDDIERPAGLFHFARTGFYDRKGISLHEMTDQSLPTFVEGASLIVDADAGAISKRQYNGELELRLRWPSGQVTAIPVPAYDDLLDETQLTSATLHGRYTGQYVVEGLPRQGLVMQIGEVPPDRNFAFLIMFTYLDGAPTWVVGNADFPIGADHVTVNMYTLEGGTFFTEPLDGYTREDVVQDRIGTMTIRPRHCNVIDAEIDFSESGLGVVTRRYERLVRIAGYDCDQTR